ncbi:MAG: ankyrin repeat domain-containing protein [Tatlockia sp.]|nr:ankyrin repeat domain-containing protein [Tatlockia sp.]
MGDVNIDESPDLKMGLDLMVDRLLGTFSKFLIRDTSVTTQLNELIELRSLNAKPSELLSYMELMQLTLHEKNGTLLVHLNSGLKEVLSLFKELKFSYETLGLTPLQGAVIKKKTDFVEALLALKVDVNAQNNLGETALFYAVSAGNVEMVNLLCLRGAIFDEKIKKNAIYQRQQSILDYFQIDSEERDKILSERNLEIGFGVAKLKDGRDYGGGSINEGFYFLSDYFKRFADFKDSKNLNNIAEDFKQSRFNFEKNANELVESLNHQGSIKSASGFRTHTIGYTIDKKEGGYQLTLAERGVFARRFPIDLRLNNKISSLQSIDVAEEQLRSVVNLLIQALRLDKEESEKMIFEDIAKITQSNWVYHPDSMQARFKAGICFYANPKSLLFFELLKLYHPDVEQAKKAYKEFSLFLHKELLKEYKIHADPNSPYIKICEGIIKTEEIKFADAFSRIHQIETSNLFFLKSKEKVQTTELSDEANPSFINKGP